ncbi:MAG: lipopolysaccharide biosynthesis protein RfbH [Candidatus Anstonellales archaeon]
MTNQDHEVIKEQILQLAKIYWEKKFQVNNNFIPGKTRINYSGRVFDYKEMQNLIESALDFWLTNGRFIENFEQKFKEFHGLNYCITTNSGSSANLLAFASLRSPMLKDNAIPENSEVITSASSFPTTVNPIIQYKCKPVFVDPELQTYNPSVETIKKAITKKTKAIMLAHTLGIPFDVKEITDICNEHNLYLIEDCCDALGAKYCGKLVGTFGHIATFSFYPAHHITTGEGGALITNNSLFKRIIESIRDWGRDCWCKPGKDNSCGRRFGFKLGDLPYGYDHKYIYSNIGYNLKMTEMQAAIGLAQLEKLSKFIEIRRRNFFMLLKKLKRYEAYFLLPKIQKNTYISPFGFPLCLTQQAPFTRHEIVTYLENNMIATRMLFGGNIIRQPAYNNIKYKKIGKLINADYIMNNMFWIGVYPGINKDMLNYVVSIFEDFLDKKVNK